MSDRKKLLEAVIEKPTTYEVDVLDNSMLPEKLKNRKTLSFVIKPPTISTLTRCAIHLDDIPEQLKKGENVNLEDAIKHTDTLIKMICVLSWGKATNYPEWYEPFMRENLTPKEVFQIFHESSMKMGTDFFLTSFQIASENPMTMKDRSDSIRIK